MKQQTLNISILSTVIVIILAGIIFYSIPKFAFCQECSVDLSFYDKSKSDMFSSNLDDLLKERKVYNFELTGKSDVDKEIFKKYRDKVHLIVKSKDTTRMIRFKFNNATNYQNFIDVFDICFIEGANYLYHKNDLWIIYKSRYRKGWKELPPIIKPSTK